MTLPDRIVEILDILSGNGFEAYAVGGCVRDMLMGKSPQDYDITTNALPEQICGCFKDFKVIETGIKHGTVTVVSGGENIEVTTYRTDGDYIDNRHPESVKFTTLIEEDLSRRDFTMNAIAFNYNHGIVDPFGGEKDIKNKTIRCVGDPDKRFNEDSLRILRAIRFAAQTGFEMEEKTHLQIFENMDLIKNLSAERVFSEFKKILCGDYARKVLREYKEVIGVVIPEILPMIEFQQNTKYHNLDVFEHTLKALENTEKDEILRLAVFFHDIGKPEAFFEDEDGVSHFKGHAKISKDKTEVILSRLKADNFTKERVCSLIGLHSDRILPDKIFLKRLISRYGFDFAHMLLKHKKADASAKAKEYSRSDDIILAEKMVEEIKLSGEPLFLSDLKINGNHLKRIGISGENIGKTLNDLLWLVIAGEAKNDLESLLIIAEEKNETGR